MIFDINIYKFMLFRFPFFFFASTLGELPQLAQSFCRNGESLVSEESYKTPGHHHSQSIPIPGHQRILWSHAVVKQVRIHGRRIER